MCGERNTKKANLLVSCGACCLECRAQNEQDTQTCKRKPHACCRSWQPLQHVCGRGVWRPESPLLTRVTPLARRYECEPLDWGDGQKNQVGWPPTPLRLVS